MQKRDIKSMLPEEISAFMKELGQPSFRAGQIFDWLQSGAKNFDEMSNLPKNLRETLYNNFYIADVFIEKKLESSIDDTVKYLYSLYDGETIESVLMHYHHGHSVCISTQVGCRMGCGFCASGIGGLVRNLTASEMLAQVMTAGTDNGVRISNVVLMGMGEPLDNFENTVRFLQLVSHSKGLNIGLRHISVSTSGVVDGIYRLMECGMPVTLSVSLHAPNDEIRDRLMPVNRKWSVDILLKACRDYIKATGRRISFEYAMIDSVNDSDAAAAELASKLKGMLCHVNLIPANPVRERDYKRSGSNRVMHFQTLLNHRGITATVRRTLGADINASCGQLRRNSNSQRGDRNEDCQQN